LLKALFGVGREMDEMRFAQREEVVSELVVEAVLPKRGVDSEDIELVMVLGETTAITLFFTTESLQARS